MSKITKNERIHALEQQVKFLIDGYKILSRHVDCTSENLASSPLIERESEELIGSELCKAMLANASKPIMCAVSDISTSKAMSLGNYDLIHDYTDEHSFMSLNQTWVYAIPINNQGEPLTASEVGL